MNNVWTLSHKISFFAMLICGIAIIAASLVSVTSQNRLAHEQASRGLKLLAQVTVYNIAAPTMFADEEAANTVLQALQLEPMVVSAQLLDMEQNQLAVFTRDANTNPQSGRTRLSQPVTWKGIAVGTLLLDYDMSRLNQKLYREIAITLVLAMLAVISAGLLVRWMSHRLTKPLRSLSRVAQTISLHGDYNLRAPLNGNYDEVGLLTKYFNEMLQLIEKQDLNLREQQETLLDSEQRLKLATASAGLGVWDLNIVEDKLLWDNRMYELYGMQLDKEETSLQTWLNNVHPQDREQAFEHFGSAQQGPNGFESVFRIVLPDGRLKHIKGNAVVLRNEQGTAERMLGINADVTEQEINLVKLKEAAELKERLAQVSKMESIGQLTAGIAHDFNNMLAAIILK